MKMTRRNFLSTSAVAAFACGASLTAHAAGSTCLLYTSLLCRSAQSRHLFFVHFVYTMQFFETICVHFQIML